MVSLKTVRASNALLSNSTSTLTAVFTGATSGIGLHTIRQLAINAHSLKAYIIGRSAEAFSHHLAELHALNPNAEFIFLEAQVSLLKDVYRVCEEIKQKESSIDLLCMSQGFLAFGSRDDTPEGLETSLSLQYYSRLLLATLLIPLLTLSPSPTILSIYGAGLEGPLPLSDLSYTHSYSRLSANLAASTMQSLSFSLLSTLHPHITFIHCNPGAVRTDILYNLLDSAPWWATLPAQALKWTVLPAVLAVSAQSGEECGERMVWLMSSEGFGKKKEKRNGGSSGGFWRIGEKGERLGVKKVLEGYEADGTREVVWEHTVGVLEAVLGREVVGWEKVKA